MNLTVVTPASSQCAAALLQGDMAGEHTLAQVLIVQIIVALLTFHRRRWKDDTGEEERNIKKSKRTARRRFQSTRKTIISQMFCFSS